MKKIAALVSFVCLAVFLWNKPHKQRSQRAVVGAPTLGPKPTPTPTKKAVANGQTKPLQETATTPSPPPWQAKLQRQLLRFHPPETRVDIHTERTLGRVKSATVVYTLKDGEQRRFKALVDTHGGQVLQTWGRTIHENLAQRRFKLIPSGTL